MTSRMKVKNFNKIIQIPKASFDDAGEYTCTATNRIGYIEHTITVAVKGETHLKKHSVHSIFLLHSNVQTTNILVHNSDSILVGEAH